VAKPGADAPDPLTSPLAKGEALLHRGHQGLGQLRRTAAVRRGRRGMG